MRSKLILTLVLVLSGCGHLSTGDSSGYAVDCRNGQTWPLAVGKLDDERKFMPELAKCPGAIILKCASKAQCDYAPFFVPYGRERGRIYPLTQAEKDRDLEVKR